MANFSPIPGRLHKEESCCFSKSLDFLIFFKNGPFGDFFLDPFYWFVLPIVKTDSIPQLVQDRSNIRTIQLGLTGGEAVNFRALNLEKFQGVEEGTLDLYGAVRNGYLQQRLNAIQE